MDIASPAGALAPNSFSAPKTSMVSWLERLHFWGFPANLQCFWGELVWNSCLEFSLETSGGWHVLKLSIFLTPATWKRKKSASHSQFWMSITSQSQLPEGSEGAMKLLNCCSKVLLPEVYLVLHIVSSVFPALFQETALGQLFVIKPSLQKTRWETREAFGWDILESRSNSGSNTSLLSIHPHRAPFFEVIGDQHPNY